MKKWINRFIFGEILARLDDIDHTLEAINAKLAAGDPIKLAQVSATLGEILAHQRAATTNIRNIIEANKPK